MVPLVRKKGRVPASAGHEPKKLGAMATKQELDQGMREMREAQIRLEQQRLESDELALEDGWASKEKEEDAGEETKEANRPPKEKKAEEGEERKTVKPSSVAGMPSSAPKPAQDAPAASGTTRIPERLDRAEAYEKEDGSVKEGEAPTTKEDGATTGVRGRTSERGPGV